jgi:DNA invertase Pin-like site-specific DNA recombinase
VAAVQLAGHDHLRKLGVTLIPATAPDFFTEDTPTAVLVRQVLGAIAQFDKATTVAKLKAARDRKIAAGEKCGGRKSYAEARKPASPARGSDRPAATRTCMDRPASRARIARRRQNCPPLQSLLGASDRSANRARARDAPTSRKRRPPAQPATSRE